MFYLSLLVLVCVFGSLVGAVIALSLEFSRLLKRYDSVLSENVRLYRLLKVHGIRYIDREVS